MKQLQAIRYLIVGTVLVLPAVQAATVVDDVKAANTTACMQMAGKFDKHAPADKSQWPTYCGCVSEMYWRSVPQTDYDGMSREYQAGNYDGAYSKSLNDHVDERLQAAQKKCSGK